MQGRKAVYLQMIAGVFRLLVSGEKINSLQPCLKGIASFIPCQTQKTNEIKISISQL